MLETFYPDRYVDSAYELPFEELYEKDTAASSLT